MRIGGPVQEAQHNSNSRKTEIHIRREGSIIE